MFFLYKDENNFKQKREPQCDSLFALVAGTGLEPMTFGL